MKTHSIWLKNKLLSLNQLLDSERKIGVQILEILLEIEKRKAYCELGYDGLFSFVVKHLKFTEAQAFQRIQAMHAIKSLPELKEKIESGAMSVSVVAQVQTYVRQEQVQEGLKISKEELAQLFQQFENKTTKEAKAQIHELRGEKIKLQLILELDEEADALWKTFRESSAHQTQGDSLNGFKLLLKSFLKTKKRVNTENDSTAVTTIISVTQPAPSPESHSNAQQTASIAVPKTMMKPNTLTSNNTPFKKIYESTAVSQGDIPQTIQQKFKCSESSEFPGNTQQTFQRSDSLSIKVNPSRYVPTNIKKQVFARDQYRCTNCESKYALTLEHIIPFANGGTHTLNNLKVLCRNCNLKNGVRTFGTERMRRA